ncbi:MAG: ABC transporter permease subunit [Gammaproteobacteria bacterium]|nr:ABC transporter permease subunit [Gammaproteobacteria bacterium]
MTLCTVVFGLPLLVLLLASFAGHWDALWPSSPTWANLRGVLASAEERAALWHSVATAGAATVCALVLGAWGALAGRRLGRRTRICVDTLFVLPITVPSVTVGLALLVTFSRPPLLWNGTVSLVVLTHVALVASYAYANAKAGLERLPAHLEEMAASLGGSPWFVLRKVTLALLMPHLLAGAALGFALSMGELGATIMLYPPGWATAPVEIFSLSDRGSVFSAAALSLALLAATATALVALERWAASRRH